MAKTLEKLQAAGLANEEGELTTLAETEVELELGGEPEPETVVVEGEEEVTIALQDDAQNRSRVEVPKATLSKLRRTRREARAQVVEKDAELSEMRVKLADLQKATLKKPQYVDFPDDASYDVALLQYHSLTSAGPATPTPPIADPRPSDPPRGPDFSEAVNAHLDRAEKLGVNLEKFSQADGAVRTVLGDLATDALINAVGDGSEKAMYLLGTRPAQLQRLQQVLADDPTGLSAVNFIARMINKVTVTKKTISGAPAVTRSPNGGQGQLDSAAVGFNKRLDAAEKAGSVQKMVAIRREARKAGVKL